MKIGRQSLICCSWQCAKLIPILSVSLLLCGCGTMLQKNDSWLGQDKLKHFVASGVIAGAGMIIADNNDRGDRESFPIVIGVTLSVGAAKEAYDLGIAGHGWSWKDFVWDVLGALSGGLVAGGLY